MYASQLKHALFEALNLLPCPGKRSRIPLENLQGHVQGALNIRQESDPSP